MEEEVPRLRVILTIVLAAVFLIGAGLAVLKLPRQDGPLVIVQPTPPASPPVKQIKVYVSGAVERPGVYTMREDQRIEDALAAAGGAFAGADLARLNLAARVRDEMQVHVSMVGEPAPAPVQVSDSRIDINTAPLALLDTLPDIGPVTAQKIISHRDNNGPFKRIEELTEAKLVGASAFAKIKDLITVR